MVADYWQTVLLQSLYLQVWITLLRIHIKSFSGMALRGWILRRPFRLGQPSPGLGSIYDSRFVSAGGTGASQTFVNLPVPAVPAGQGIRIRLRLGASLVPSTFTLRLDMVGSPTIPLYIANFPTGGYAVDIALTNENGTQTTQILDVSATTRLDVSPPVFSSAPHAGVTGAHEVNLQLFAPTLLTLYTVGSNPLTVGASISIPFVVEFI